MVLPVDSTSPTLLQRVRQSDSQAWRELTQLYGPMVADIASRMGLSHADVEDVTQDVFIIISRKLPTFQRTRKKTRFRGWLRTITVNRTIDLLRKQKKTPELPFLPELLDAAFPADSVGSVGADPGYLQSEEEQLQLRAANIVRARVSSRQWECFTRMAVEEESAADIASDFNMTSAAVRQAKYRTLREILAVLDEEIV